MLRREASLLDPGLRADALREAVRLARRSGDSVGEVEGLEDLARDAGTSGKAGTSVALLAVAAGVQAARADRAGFVRAVMLAGRTLCEAWGPDRDVPSGMVMLLWAESEARRFDDTLGRLLKDYLTGFQYTLSEAEFAEVEPFLALDPRAVVDATLARYMEVHREELP